MKTLTPATFYTGENSLPAGVIEQIRCRAYQLYEDRGRVDGYALEDWLRAEAEIMTQKVMRKAASNG